MLTTLLMAILTGTALLGYYWLPAVRAQAPTLYWGTAGSDVRAVQSRLSDWGYYNGPVDGVFGAETSAAIREFQRLNGLTVDGLVGEETWAALGLPGGPARAAAAPANYKPTTGVSGSQDLNLLARVVAAEAGGEPYQGQVAVASVILNRVKASSFPNTLPGVVYQPLAFESVSNGLVWRVTDLSSPMRAAQDAMNGWDPTYGSLFFWNPAKPVNRWIWTRDIVVRIGKHVFAR
ncbi:hypothetical protein SY88_19330 [Clostridiales bacterium PH28_bin88]|nr:hypothetical protein SY88_19330 [Clostridiales bacterium PH28_bin88]